MLTGRRAWSYLLAGALVGGVAACGAGTDPVESPAGPVAVAPTPNPTPEPACPNPPAPNLVVVESPPNAFRLVVTNAASYPGSLFASSPDLPPCGANTRASRTW